MPKAHKGPVGKSTKVIHPNSRTAGYIRRQNHHYDRVFKTKALTSEKNERLRQKLQWYQDNMDPTKTVYTKSGLAELTLDYLNRFQDELDQISIINSIGKRKSKQHVARSEAIRLTKEREKQEFEGGGIDVPDLSNEANCEYFRNWTGEVRYFPNIKICKSRKSDIEKKTDIAESSSSTNDNSENQENN